VGDGDAADAAQDWNTRIIGEFRASGGKVAGFEGTPLLLLHTTGARSGHERVHPVTYLDDDGHLYVFASKAGADSNPDWYHNLLAHPDVTAELGDATVRATAVPLAGAERDRVFAVHKARFPTFAAYEAKTRRVIPVVELRRG
jgi:deazaflavin-dependent oxidoreductase (nitroreductase family)